MNNILHYVLWGTDNGSYWVPDLKCEQYCCTTCGSKLSRDIRNEKFYLKKKSYDVSVTFDGFLIGSQKFVSLLSEIDSHGFSTCQIPPDPRYPMSYFKIEFTKIIRIDRHQAAPQFGPVCEQCCQHKYIVGAREYFLEGSPCLARGILRTDLEFGDGFEKSPVIIVGIESARVLLGAKLKGMTLDPVFAPCVNQSA
jgi:hypothetical protein